MERVISKQKVWLNGIDSKDNGLYCMVSKRGGLALMGISISRMDGSLA